MIESVINSVLKP